MVGWRKFLLWLLPIVASFPLILKWTFDIIGWSTAPGDAVELYHKLSEMPWWIAYGLAICTWIAFFVAPPLWDRYIRVYSVQEPEHSTIFYPDWTIRELFLHIDPHLISAGDARWKTVDQLIHDALATGRLTAWGRDDTKGKFGNRAPQEEIEKGYWLTAGLMLNFFLPGEDHQYLIYARPSKNGGPQYRDIQVNKAQALKIWPTYIELACRPLRDLFKEAEKQGWDFTGDSHDILNFAKALRQAAFNGQLTFSGRQSSSRIDILRRRALLEIMGSEHWRDYEIDWPPSFNIEPPDGKMAGVRADNFRSRSQKLNTAEEGYFDLHVDWDEALKWLVRQSPPKIQEAS